MPSIYHTAQWKAVRKAALRRDGYRCIICQVSIAGPGQARVDHIHRLSDGGAPFDLGNLRSLCTVCDAQGHREKGTRGATRVERFVRRGADTSGRPTDPEHHWNRR